MNPGQKVAFGFLSVAVLHVVAVVPFLWLEAASRDTVMWFRPGPGVGFALPYFVEFSALLILAGMICAASEELPQENPE